MCSILTKSSQNFMLCLYIRNYIHLASSVRVSVFDPVCIFDFYCLIIFVVSDGSSGGVFVCVDARMHVHEYVCVCMQVCMCLWFVTNTIFHQKQHMHIY